MPPAKTILHLLFFCQLSLGGYLYRARPPLNQIELVPLSSAVKQGQWGHPPDLGARGLGFKSRRGHSSCRGQGNAFVAPVVIRSSEVGHRSSADLNTTLGIRSMLWCTEIYAKRPATAPRRAGDSPGRGPGLLYFHSGEFFHQLCSNLCVQSAMVGRYFIGLLLLALSGTSDHGTLQFPFPWQQGNIISTWRHEK
jgi:hypothetical protein